MEIEVAHPVKARQWQGAAVMDVGAIDAQSPHVALVSDGRAFVVWSQPLGTKPGIWSSFCKTGGGWSAADLVGKHDHINASAPRIAMDTFGNTFVVWEQLMGARFTVWSIRCTASGSWDSPVLLQKNLLISAFAPRIAVDSRGHALAVWQQLENQRYSIWASRFIAGRGWSAEPELVERQDGTNALRPELALGRRGDALVVWERALDTGSRMIWCKRYTPSYGWGRAEPLHADTSGLALRPRVTMDAGGDALVLWHQSRGTGHAGIWSNRYDEGSGWRTAAPVDLDMDIDFTPQIAADAFGNVLAVWSHVTGPRVRIWSKRFNVGSDWSESEEIGVHEATSALAPQVAVAPNGCALAVWARRARAGTQIWCNRLD
jgi:hypothetical protein